MYTAFLRKSKSMCQHLQELQTDYQMLDKLLERIFHFK